MHQRLSRKHGRRTKEVEMVRHDDIAANAPRFRPLPCVEDHSHRIGVREQWLTSLTADRQKNNNRFVKPFANCRMRRIFAADFHYL